MPYPEPRWKCDSLEYEMRAGLREGRFADRNSDPAWRLVSANLGQNAGLQSEAKADALRGQICAGERNRVRAQRDARDCHHGNHGNKGSPCNVRGRITRSVTIPGTDGWINQEHSLQPPH